MHSTDETSIQPGKNVRGPTLKLGKSANCPDDKRDVHRGLQTFSADIAENDQSGSAIQRDDLEEVSANLACRMVGTLYGVARDPGDRLRDHHPLDLTRRSQLILDLGLLPMISHGVAHEGVGKDEEKQRIEHFSRVVREEPRRTGIPSDRTTVPPSNE